MSRWEPGIPAEIAIEDRLTPEELMNMAIAEVKEELKKNGEELVGVNPNIKSVPNIIARKDGKTKFITVRAGVIPVVPRLLPEFGQGMIKHAEKYGADCYFAGVAFGSADDERFQAGILLRGDNYLCNYTGMQRVQFR